MKDQFLRILLERLLKKQLCAMVLVPNYMFGGENCKIKFSLYMFLSHNGRQKKYAYTIPSTKIANFENLQKTLLKIRKPWEKNIVHKVWISIILQKSSEQRLLNLLTLKKCHFKGWQS